MTETVPEIRIGVGGNVDAGKSSFVGVITKNKLDDGRGYARSFVLKHKHEKESGRTSALSQQYIRLSDRVLEFNDLAGHAKYYKCTVKELSNTSLDYVAIVIGSNAGIQLMTREHISLAYSLRIPMFIIYTKIDTTPKNIYEMNLEYIKSFYKKNMNLETKIINTTSDLQELQSGNVPIFPISNVTGQGLDIIQQYFSKLEKNFQYDATKEVNFQIHHKYQLQGFSLIVSGVMISGTVKIGDTLYLGPLFNNKGSFMKVTVKSIHNNFKENIDCLKAGHSGCFNIKAVGGGGVKLKRNMIKNGMRMLSKLHSVSQFEAKIKLYKSSSTITTRYQPILHCCGISQAIQIVKMDKEYLRSHDEAIITCKFMFRPEYIEIGNIFILREGNLKAIGKVLEISNPEVQ